MKAVQTFSDEYLENCRQLRPDEILRFLEDFRLLHSATPSQSKLISMKVPMDLLSTFRAKCELSGVRYQTQIKQLMLRWLNDEHETSANQQR